VDNRQNTIETLGFEKIDRAQSLLLPIDIEELMAPDHSARHFWNFVGRLKLDAFVEDGKATEGQAGRDAIHPRLRISMWVHAITRGIHSARLRAARARTERLERPLDEMQRSPREKKNERGQPASASTTDPDVQFMRPSDHGVAPCRNVP
jgi:transposase